MAAGVLLLSAMLTTPVRAENATDRIDRGRSSDPIGTLSSVVPIDKTWARSVDLIRGGRIEEAGTLINKIAGQGPSADKVAGWLADWTEQEELRRQLTQADYDRYVGKAKKWQAKEDFLKAIEWAYAAKLNAPDADAFVELPWMVELSAQAMQAASEFHGKKEWRKAHGRYYALSLIFENDKEIDKLRKECLEHARLDEIYKEGRDWEESLEGVSADSVEEIFWHIAQKYVVEADFRAMTIAGYEELLLIAESPTLAEQFDGLQGERGEDFVSRVTEKLHQIRQERKTGSAGGLTHRNALKYFRRALLINSQTARIPEAVIVREYTGAAREQLDEFTSVIWPQDYREFEKHTRGDFIGVGIQIHRKDNEVVVSSPLPRTPAYRAGIQRDDVITHVNGKPLLGLSLTKAVTMITGPLGTTVTLTIRRRTESGQEKSIDFALKRDRVKIFSVKGAQHPADDEESWEFLSDTKMGIAYFRVDSFQENTVADLYRALSEAKAAGMKAVILDLRFNPGGLLTSAVRMAELFLERGNLVVSTKGLRSEELPISARYNGEFKELPLIVLVNEYSASASEIVAGAIKDHGRGTIVGQRTFGKFSVQNLIPLIHSGEAHLKLTTARYYLPSGKSLHRDKDSTEWGVEPDVVVKLVPKEVRKILDMQRAAEVIGPVAPAASESSKDDQIAAEPADGQGDGATDNDGATGNDNTAGDNADVEVETEPAITAQTEATTKTDNAVDEAADGSAAQDKDAGGSAEEQDRNMENGDGEEGDEEEEEEPEPNNRPDRDPQLELAMLLMRVHLLDREGPQFVHAQSVTTSTEPRP